MITIIDLNLGNLGSIHNIIDKVKGEAIISSKIEDIENADKLILPGVGSFDQGMNSIQNLGLLPVLQKKVIKEKVPILGICLGIQLFTKKSEEGSLPGLSWLDAITVKFNFKDAYPKLKIPHMGWNQVKIRKKSPLYRNIEDDGKFYFVHSYHVICYNEENILSTTEYGYEFVSSIQKDNILGTQFHPEKSHRFGINLMRNFVELL